MDVQIDCPCPRKADGEPRHAHDTVTLRDRLDFRQATAIRNTIAFAKAEDDAVSPAEMMAYLTEGYVLHGIESWTLTDEKGKAVPVTKAEIRARLLSDPLQAEAIGEAADSLYGPAILLPLLQRASASSQPSPTPTSTSVTTTSRPKRQRPSKPSSTSTSGTDGIATITSLRVGGSNSSPSSASAA